MSYLIAKTLHLLCVFAWFAGLTYLPRLLVAVAAVEPQAHAERQRLLQLASSLCRFTLIVTAPVLLTGLWLWMGFELKGGWLHYKATLAAGLFAYALHCRRILLDMKSGHNLRTVGWLKVFAHGQILVLVAMVVLAVFKPF